MGIPLNRRYAARRSILERIERAQGRKPLARSMPALLVQAEKLKVRLAAKENRLRMQFPAEKCMLQRCNAFRVDRSKEIRPRPKRRKC